MRHVSIIGLFTALIPAVLIAAVPDTLDTTLIAYRLSTTQEAQYSRTDGAFSSFWSEWAAQNASGLNRDYYSLLPATHGFNRKGNAFTGPSDAAMTVRAAYGQNGVYLCFQVTDDRFITPLSTTQRTDYLQLEFDNQSSDSIAGGNSFDIMVQPLWWTLTMFTKEIQVAMGHATAPTAFRYSMFDGAGFNAVVHAIDSAGTLYDGMGLEVLGIDATHRVQEWFIPWTQWGIGGVAAVPSEGRRLAIAGGYNDMDSGSAAEDTSYNVLRYKNQTDPWQGVTLWPWADLEIGPALSPSVRAVSNDVIMNAVTRPMTLSVNGRSVAIQVSRSLPSKGMTGRILRADGSVAAVIGSVFDGEFRISHPLPAGVYWCRLSVAGQSSTQQFTVR